MDKYLVQLIGDLENALDNLPELDTFRVLYGDPGESEEPTGPEKPLAEWFDIEPAWFPPSNRLTEEQKDIISKVLLSFWEDEDPIHTWMQHLTSTKRYECLIKFLNSKHYYDGMGGFYASGPQTDEEWVDFLKDIKVPLDSLDMDLGIYKIDPDEEEDLPF